MAMKKSPLYTIFSMFFLSLRYSETSVTSFKPKTWKEGFNLNALLHAFKPELFRYSDLSKMDDVDRISHALRHAEENFDVHALFTAEGAFLLCKIKNLFKRGCWSTNLITFHCL